MKILWTCFGIKRGNRVINFKPLKLIFLSYKLKKEVPLDHFVCNYETYYLEIFSVSNHQCDFLGTNIK